MTRPIKLLIADDHSLFRDAVRTLLKEQKRIEVCAEAGDGNELIKLAAKHNPDVIITDVQMPGMNGIEASRIIKNKYPLIRIIALTMHSDDYLIVDMLDAGASGYVIKATTTEELMNSIITVYEGGNYFCHYTSIQLTNMIARSKSQVLGGLSKANFSSNEKEIIRLICEQRASKEIANITGLAHRTVEKYRDRIMEKTGSRNMAGIVVFAIRNGIFKP